MEKTMRIYAIIALVKAQRKNTCILCEESVYAGNDVVKITTAKNTYAVCPTCYGLHTKMRKSGNTAKNTVGKLTVYNDIIGYTVNVVSKNPKTRAYIMTQNNWKFSDIRDENGDFDRVVANYKAVNFQAISPMLDSIFCNDDTVKVTVNHTVCKNTEEVRKAIEMKVNNAVVNKSVK